MGPVINKPPAGRQRIMKMKNYEEFCCGFLNQGTVLAAFHTRFGYYPEKIKFIEGTPDRVVVLITYKNGPITEERNFSVYSNREIYC
jgi:hypothetical protein